jgi:hypothetical protein
MCVIHTKHWKKQRPKPSATYMGLMSSYHRFSCSLTRKTTMKRVFDTHQQECEEVTQNNLGSTPPYHSVSDERNDPLYLFGQQLMKSNFTRVVTFYNNSRRRISSKLAARSLGEGIIHAKVEELKFINDMKETTNAGDEPGSYLQIFYDYIRSSPTIHKVALEQFWVSELNDFASVLSSMRSLHWLVIEYFSGSFGKVLFLADVLIQQTSLVRLKFYSGTLEHSDVRNLAQGLHQNRSLKTLELCFCMIDDRDVRCLMEHWPRDSPLKRIYLPDNNIGPAGVQSLLQAAHEHPALRKINLEGNIDIGYEGARVIGNALHNLPHITHLNVTNIISSSELAQVQAKIHAEQALMDGIVRNSGIFELSARENGFSDVSQDSIRLYTALNNLGRYLLTADHGLPLTIWCHVFAGIVFGRNRMREKHGFCHKEYTVTSIYSFLREQPQLMVQPR